MYTRRLTAADINNAVTAETVNAAVTAETVNAAVTAETVNALVDLSGEFNPARYQDVFSGSATGVSLPSYGMYLVRAGLDGAIIPQLSAIVLYSENDGVTEGSYGEVVQNENGSIVGLTNSVGVSSGFKIMFVGKIG